ncbi:glycosyltransferase [Geitlerinema sp. P-1104]|uniref:glycosyltransferase n=1 Tax=Geitlerinema sp. P-1104 TaxID=2546230 RepID=UPI0014778355|nr:glycosyltransferase [Geitlerinema sp. P-1104]NMG60897.1 glycosyltransferase [Geitlerinema sp. P-1104]
MLILTLLSLTIWITLLAFRGQFWRSHIQLSPVPPNFDTLPSVCAIIPARNEADVLPKTLRSLFLQENISQLQVILVDDRSDDGTADAARAIAADINALGEELNLTLPQLDIITADPLPPGWSGKLWAMDQGIHHGERHNPDYYLLTDADIQHHPQNLQQLLFKAERDGLDLVSLMVKLRCQSIWERLLIPPFIYFFQKLYPFDWVNNPQKSTAAAAGGCILIRRPALERIGGLAAIKETLIDDCALAQAVKRGQGQEYHGIWLGLSQKTISLRPYRSLWSIWGMVARTAYTQLNYSPLLLLFTLLAMGVTYLIPPIALIWGIQNHDSFIAFIGFATWFLMAFSLLPTLRFYQQPPFLGLILPLIAALYSLMTLDSALRHGLGRGGAWKGRVYRGKGTA